MHCLDEDGDLVLQRVALQDQEAVNVQDERGDDPEALTMLNRLVNSIATSPFGAPPMLGKATAKELSCPVEIENKTRVDLYEVVRRTVETQHETLEQLVADSSEAVAFLMRMIS